MRRASPPRIRDVFVDSSGYYALLRRHDQRHADAVAVLDHLTESHARLYTTRYVLAETHALLVKKAPKVPTDEALRLLTAIEQGASTTIVPVSDADEAEARRILARFPGHEFTLTDTLSFAVMDRLKLRYALAFDLRDFQTYGFVCLTRELLA